MAKIWAVYEGKHPTIGSPWARLPLPEAIDLFELRANDYISDLTLTPRFGDVDRDLAYTGFKHVVVEVEPGEGRDAKWKSGFYKSKVTSKEAFRRLIEQALVTELGSDNVVRVEYEPTIDSQGRDALKIKVVITPGATQQLGNGAALNASVRLQARLREMREHRTPIIEYATEEELEQDGDT